MKKSFESMYKTNLPKIMIGLVIADCWSGKNKDINKQEQKQINYKTELVNFDNIINLTETFFNEIKLEKSKYKYHIIAGIMKNPIWNINEQSNDY